MYPPRFQFVLNPDQWHFYGIEVASASLLQYPQKLVIDSFTISLMALLYLTKPNAPWHSGNTVGFALIGFGVSERIIMPKLSRPKRLFVSFRIGPMF